MDVYEAIEKRRTVRIFKKGATEEQLRRIILAGAKAPSAGNRQPWEFIIVDDSRIIDQLGKGHGDLSNWVTVSSQEKLLMQSVKPLLLQGKYRHAYQ